MNDETLIIGAGPAGLGMAGRLTHAGIPYKIIEQADRVAYSWTQHYDRLHLHTVNKYSALPHLDFAPDVPTFVSRDDLVHYLTYYADRFEINPTFNQSVQSIQKSEGGWLVKTQDNEYLHKKVIVATGINRVSVEPKWPGMENFEGTIIHSRNYKNPDPYIGRRVLVVGMGNTGAEIALDLCNHDAETFISVRSPVNIVPLKVLGRPTQRTALILAKFPNWFADFMAILLRTLTIGNLSKYGIETPKLAPSAQLREEGKTPVIDLGTARKIRSEDIRVVPGIEQFDKSFVKCTDGARVYIDDVILCTGYRSQLTDFIPEVESHLDKFGNPSHPVGKEDLSGLYFLGFNNFRPGGILGAIHQDTKTILEHIQSS